MRQTAAFQSIQGPDRWIIVAIAAVILAACQSPSPGDRKTSTAFYASSPSPARANVAQDTETAVISQATAYAQRLQPLVNTPSPRPEPPQEPASPPPAVQWIDLRPAAEPSSVSPSAPNPAAQPPPPESAEKPTPPESSSSSSSNTAPSLEACDRQVLLAELARRLRSGSEPALRRAVAVVGLMLTDPSVELSETDLEPLDPSQRQLIQRFARLVRELAAGLESGQPEPTVNQVRQLLEEWTGPRPLRIRTLQLCRRVRGFGVYETLGTDRFLAGRSHRMILYLELENFRSQPSTAADGTAVFQVRLQQQVRLFHAADGLEVWRLEPVQIVDESRNQRRDFFVVQLIELPANLTVGRYLLKVRVEDVHGGSVDEATAEIHIVADPALISLNRPAQTPSR